MPTCLSCYKHFKLKASDDIDTSLCRHCEMDYTAVSDDDYISDDLDSATRIDIDNMLNPSGRTPARYND